MSTSTRTQPHTLSKKSAFLVLLLATSLSAHGAVSDLASAPLITTPTASVLPNVFLMVDDSGSMAWDYMPDKANFSSGKYGAASGHCNGVYYNPAIKYIPPVDSTGTSYPNSVFTDAKTDGFDLSVGATKVDLSTSFVSAGGDPAQAAFYYRYSGTQTTEKLKDYNNTNSTFYKECNSNVGSAPGNGVFSKVTVSTISGQGLVDLNNDGVVNASDTNELTNFANWYSYYRTRMLTMKTATGLAFKTIDSSFRVGMATMNNNGGSKFLGLSPFTASHKLDLYDMLYSVTTGSSTPLRQALANVGKMYANKLTTFNDVSVVDPIEYSCQQNFALLTTDGYWNQSATSNACTNTTNCALAAKLTAGNIGNQDGVESRPMYDGAINAKTTSQTRQTDTQITASTSQLQKWTTQLQSQTSSLQQQSGTLQWQTNQQQTTANLQWQTDLQKTAGPLQWQTNLQKTTAPLQWQTNLQQTTYQLAMWTDQMQVTAPLLRSTATYTATVYRLTISNTLGGTYSNAASSTTYNCISSGTGSGLNKYCALGTLQSTTTNLASCTSTYNNPGSSTTNGTGRVTVCSQTGWSTPVAVGANGTCSASATVQCSTGTASAPAYVTNYPTPSCAVTYNAAGTSTADASGQVVTSCPTDGSGSPLFKQSPATLVGANNSCDWLAPHAGNPHMACDIVGAPSTNYVNTFPPTCATFAPVGGFVTADSGGNVTTGCSVNAAYSTAVTVPSNTTCTGGATGSVWGDSIQCVTGTATTSYVTTYPPTCATNYNGVSGTSTPTGTSVITACPVNAAFSAGTSVGANGTCDSNLPNVQCSVGATTTSYINTYPPTCAITTPVAGVLTADASGQAIVACPTAGTFSAGANVGASGTCDPTLPNVQCTTASPVTSYVTAYPPSCTVNYPAAGANTADASGKVITACPVNAAFGSWTNTAAAGSCTPGANVNCQYAWGAWSGTTSCTTNFSSGAGAWTITTGTQCQYTPFSGWSNHAASTCTTVAQSAASPFTVGTARNCQIVNVTTPANTPAWPAPAWIGAASCTPSSPLGSFDGTGKSYECQTVTTGPTPVASCSNTAASAGNSYTATTCANNTLQLNVPVSSCTPAVAAAGNGYVTTTCNTVLTGPVNTTSCVPDPATATNNWTTTACSLVSGGTYDTLADVAEYYYMTDLRTTALGNKLSGAPGAVNGTDVGTLNNVPPSGLDSVTHQHMTTFTLGLGARGRMVFDPNYQTATTGDYYAVKLGSTANSTSGVCSWQTDNTICDWPIPKENAMENIDDLWHAAVNGRGTYFSAANPSDLSLGLTSALAGVSARRGSAAAATTSTAFITQNDNFMFHSSFVSNDWVGNLTMQRINVSTGKVSATIEWSAQSKLDSNSSRTIHFFDSSSTTNLSPFLWANLSPTEQGYFGLTQIQSLSQSCAVGPTCLSAADQALAAGANLLNYIRGDHTNEGAITDNTKYYRQRQHVLGDIVNSESVYVKSATAFYRDPGYNAFKASATVTSRKAMVYVGGNDGMLHAFRAADDPSTTPADEGGQEDWAYVPSFVIPKLYKLADKGYGTKHQYYVDGSPVAADICTLNCSNTASAVWKTILVGGLNGGGRGYYALDITNPANPKALWEFTDTNMGYSFGNPKIVKLKDGRWVVLVTSGYNNVAPDAPSGDGKGHLYVLDAASGTLIRDLTTGVGTTASPSGLARIEAPVSSPGFDATALAVYGGDLEGNVWRFDINGADIQVPARWSDIGSAGYDVQLLATLRGPSPANNVQPITSKPLISLSGSTLMVMIGTGRYLGSSDIPDTSVQSFYSMKDTLAAGSPTIAVWGNPRTQGTFVQQLQVIGTCPPGTAASICTPGSSVTLSTSRAVTAANGGWYFDFPHSGERVNTDPDIVYGTIVLAANIPSTTSCAIGGESYAYFVNYLTGGAVSAGYVATSNLGGQSDPPPSGWGTDQWGVSASKFGNEILSKPNVIYLPDGSLMACYQGSGGGDPECKPIPPPNPIAVDPRRISWRELMQ